MDVNVVGPIFLRTPAIHHVDTNFYLFLCNRILKLKMYPHKGSPTRRLLRVKIQIPFDVILT